MKNETVSAQSDHTLDIVIAGGGLGGSCFAGVMARAGCDVLLVEREDQFRDRVRGESTFPWGVADIERLGLRELFNRAGAVDIAGLRIFTGRQPSDPYYWANDSIDGLPMLGFVHPDVQQAAITWAAEQGATIVRPGKIERVTAGVRPVVEVRTSSGTKRVSTRLVVGADGRNGASRRWTGGDTGVDPQNHRMGGVLVSGVRWDQAFVEMSSSPVQVAYWFPVNDRLTRIFMARRASALRSSRVVSDFETFMEVIRNEAPADRFPDVQQAGPLAFFPNQCTWATRISGEGVTLIGDVVGSLDPTQGHGTSLLFRDIRVLSELLLAEGDWQTAIESYAAERVKSFDVLRAFDRWMTMLRPTSNPDAERLRHGHLRAIEADPALGGWRMLSARGPDGLVADEASRRHFFGEDL